MICHDCETEIEFCQRCGTDLRAAALASKGDRVTTVGVACVGLLMLVPSGCLIAKTEYSNNGRSICYLIESGEYYCGDGDAAECVELKVEAVPKATP